MITKTPTGEDALPPMTGSVLSESEREALSEYFAEGWRRVKTDDEHWIHGCNRDHDEGLSYCYECAEKEIEKLTKEDPEGEWILDGGWGGESDSTPFCEGCGKMLSASLTNYGCEAELQHFLENGFDVTSDEDRRAMHEVIESRGWEECEHRTFSRDYERRESERYFADLHVLGRRIQTTLSGQKRLALAPRDEPPTDSDT